MRTFTPDLDGATLKRLAAYAESFSADFPRKDQGCWTEAYLLSRLHDGERKSVEPSMARITLPPQCGGKDPVQAVQHWLNQGGWDEEPLLERYRTLMRATFGSPEGHFIFDDTSFFKQGSHSVGVQPQYCGSLGKRANCQVAVSLHYSSPTGHYPLAMRLHLPKSWTDVPKRLDKARVPPKHRIAKTKHQIALELLDQVRAEGQPGRVVLADAGYGSSWVFRAELEARKLTYVVGVKAETVVFTEKPSWELPGDKGVAPNRRNPRLAAKSPPPRSLSKIAATTPLRQSTWRTGTKGPMAARFARVRVWPAHEWREGKCANAQPVWLLVEERGTELRYTLSNAPADASLVELVRLLKNRWPVEQGYQQLKEELGLDHFEGRSWKGFHHNICMTFLAFGFLELERHKLRSPAGRGAKKKPNRNADHSLCSACSAKADGNEMLEVRGASEAQDPGQTDLTE
jgi:SRSO17 transposase